MYFFYFFAPLLVFLLLLFPFLTHPLSMGINLLFLTLLLSLMVGLFHSSMWMSYAMILVLLGGLLVIFVYVSLLASNETLMRPSKMSSFFMIFMPVLSVILFSPFKAEILNSKINLNFPSKFNWMSDFYSLNLGLLTLFLLFYLLLTLLVVVYNTKNKNATLRSNL